MDGEYLFRHIDVEADRHGADIAKLVKDNFKDLLCVNHYRKSFKAAGGKSIEVVIERNNHHYNPGYDVTIKFPYRSWWYRRVELYIADKKNR